MMQKNAINSAYRRLVFARQPYLDTTTGDGAGVTEETLLTLTATDQTEVLLFELP